MCDKHSVCCECCSILQSILPGRRMIGIFRSSYPQYVTCMLSSACCSALRLGTASRKSLDYVGTVRCSEGAGTDAQGRNTLGPPSEEQNHTHREKEYVTQRERSMPRDRYCFRNLGPKVFWKEGPPGIEPGQGDRASP